MTGPGPAGATELIASRYRLLRALQATPASEIFVARDEVLAREVAVEIVKSGVARDVEACARFRRAAVQTGRVSHPNLIALFDTGEIDGRPFVVTEIPAGRSVRQLLDTDGAFEASTAVAVCAQVADALAHMHSAGIVHGAVTTEAIVLEPVRNGEKPPVKITVGNTTTDGAEPEEDVAGLGRALYEMLTARRPDADPAPPSSLRPALPRQVDDVVIRACQGALGSMSEFRAHLLDLAAPDDARPVVVRDPTPPQGSRPVSSFARSERSWLVPAVLVVVAGVALAVVGVTLAQTELGRGLLAQPRARAPVPIAAVVPFDPQGDGEENNAMIAAAVDGDPRTAWRTDLYRTPEFGRLKDGLGLVVETADTEAERHLIVDSPTPGWSATVHAAPNLGADVAAWGPPVDDIGDAGNTEEAVVPAGSGRFLLLWFTRLPASGRVEVAAIRVES